MAFRTPLADGLTIPPNAPGDGRNPPSAPQEVQQPKFWGRFATVEALPNVGVVDGVTVVGTNPTANPAFSNMRPGDVALVQGDEAVGRDTLYTLDRRGTIGGNNAEWSVASFPPTRFDAAIGKAQKTAIIFRETFGSGVSKLISAATGAGAVATPSIVVSGFIGPGRLGTGTTAAGVASFQTSSNVIYATGLTGLDGDTLASVRILSTVAEEFDAHFAYVGEAGGNGYSITYRRTVSVNWQLVRWAAGVPTFVVDTGIAVNTDVHRFRTKYDVATASVECFIDGVAVGSIGAVPAVSASIYLPALIRKTAGTTSREIYVLFARLFASYSTQRPA